MLRKIRFFSLITLSGLLGTVLLLAVSIWAQKAKPPKPPVPPADPAIAYVVREPNTRGKLMIMNADGTNQQVVLTEKMVEYGDPDWSPDGKTLVFGKNDMRGSGSGIYTININGTELRRVVPYGRNPRWSPVPLGDGSYKIAFIDTELFLVNLDGTGLVQLTHSPEREWDLSWSYSGQYLVVWTFSPEGEPLVDDYILYQIDYDGNRFVATSLGSIFNGQDPVIQNNTYGGAIDWANTQDKLIVSVNAPENNSYDLWIVDLFNSANTFRLTNTLQNSEWEPSWSPDDSRVSCIRDDVLWIMNLDGSGQTLIGPGFLDPQWRRNF